MGSCHLSVMTMVLVIKESRGVENVFVQLVGLVQIALYQVHHQNPRVPPAVVAEVVVALPLLLVCHPLQVAEVVIFRQTKQTSMFRGGRSPSLYLVSLYCWCCCFWVI